MGRRSKITFFIFAMLFFILDRTPTSSGYSLTRIKRQARRGGSSGKREEGAVDESLIDTSLFGWEPWISADCPPQQYICRDRSYCFPTENLCNDLVSCNDQSDEVNALCGYTTPATNGATFSTEATSFSIPTNDSNDGLNINNERNRFNDPLVIAFLVFVICTLIYVVAATVCCIKHRMNVIRPNDTNVTSPSTSTSKVTNSPQSQQGKSIQSVKQQNKVGEERKIDCETDTKVREFDYGSLTYVN